MKVSNTSSRLKKILALRGMKQIELVEKTGLGKSAISQYVSGKVTPKQDKLYALARALNVSPTWLMGFDTPMQAGDTSKYENVFVPELKKVPMLGYAAAGQPLENLDGQDTYYVQVESDQPVDFCITVRGDSMVGAGIDDGDIVFVRQQPEIENGQIGCFEIDGNRVCLKRFYKTGASVTLVSENPKYDPMVFSEDNCMDFKVLGLAVIKQSKIH
jgi:repressor LexA